MNDQSLLRPHDRDIAMRRLRSIRTGAAVGGLAAFAGLAAVAGLTYPGSVDATVASVGTSQVTTSAVTPTATTTTGTGTSTSTTVAGPTQTPTATAAPAQVTSGGSG